MPNHLQELLQQARAIRPAIYSVHIEGTVLADGDTFTSYLAKDTCDEWRADSPEELLADIREWS